MEEIAKTTIINLIARLNSTELFILSLLIVTLGGICGTFIFAISRGVTDIFGKRILDYKHI